MLPGVATWLRRAFRSWGRDAPKVDEAAMAKKAQERAIVFDASIAKVQTLVDGGLRVQFDLPETAVKQVSQMPELGRDGRAVHVSVVAA